MNWNAWSDFLAMGGYAGYVWSAVLSVFVLLVAEQVSLRLRRKTLLQQYARRNDGIPDEEQA